MFKSFIKFIAALFALCTFGGLYLLWMYTSIDYKNYDSFKVAFESGEVKSGDQAIFEVKDAKSNPVLGTEIWVSDKAIVFGYPRDFEIGDKIIVDIDRIEMVFGILWIMSDGGN